jgi:hypothetical protein
VYVRIRGVYRSKVVPASKTTDELKDERENLRVDLRRELGATGRGDTPKPEDEPFGVAADRYLQAVTSLPTYSERERDIALWVAEFGGRKRGTISSADIRTVRYPGSRADRG